MTRLLGWVAVVVLLAPLAMSVWVSFTPDSLLTPPTGEWSLRWYAAFASDARWTAALGRSVVIAVVSAMLAMLAGGMLAYAVARQRFTGRSLLAAAAMLPAVVPPVVLGMGMLPLLFAARLYGSPLGIVLAHAALALPVVFTILRAHFERGGEMEDAARGLGASAWQAFLRVTLPLALPSLAAAGLAAFVMSLNEAMVTVFLSTPATETLPAVVWPQLKDSASPLAAVASCASVATALLAVAAVTSAAPRPGRR